jgi:hypothetical protein
VERMPRHAPFRWLRSAAFLAALLMLAGCANGPTITTATGSSPATSTMTPTPPPNISSARGCDNPSPVSSEKHGLEVQGVMRGGEPFYALFAGTKRLTAGRRVITYLRLPGARVVRMTLVGPDDRLVRVGGLRPGLAPFPWDRPGDPWVGTLTFSRGGCWRVYLDRSGYDGELWVRVH